MEQKVVELAEAVATKRSLLPNLTAFWLTIRNDYMIPQPNKSNKITAKTGQILPSY